MEQTETACGEWVVRMKAMKGLLFPSGDDIPRLSCHWRSQRRRDFFFSLNAGLKQTKLFRWIILIRCRWIYAESCWSWFCSQAILVKAGGGLFLGFLVGDGREDMDSILWAVLVRSQWFTESTEKVEEEKRRDTSVFYFLCVSFPTRCPWERLYFFRWASETKKNTSQRSSGCSAGCCNILTVSLYCFLKTAQRKTPHKSFFFAYSCQRMAPHLKVEYVLSFRRIKNCFFLYIMWLFSDCSLWSVLVHLSVFCSDLFTSLSGLVCDSQYDLLE